MFPSIGVSFKLHEEASLIKKKLYFQANKSSKYIIILKKYLLFSLVVHVGR